jgi:hypothetical protein
MEGGKYASGIDTMTAMDGQVIYRQKGGVFHVTQAG